MTDRRRGNKTMATMELRTKEHGKRYFRIRAYFNGKRYFKSWEWPEGWTEKRARKAVEDVARDFERECQQGKVQNRAEKKEETARILAEQAKIKTVSQYALQVDFVFIAYRLFKFICPQRNKQFQKMAVLLIKCFLTSTFFLPLVKN